MMLMPVPTTIPKRSGRWTRLRSTSQLAGLDLAGRFCTQRSRDAGDDVDKETACRDRNGTGHVRICQRRRPTHNSAVRACQFQHHRRTHASNLQQFSSLQSSSNQSEGNPQRWSETGSPNWTSPTGLCLFACQTHKVTKTARYANKRRRTRKRNHRHTRRRTRTHAHAQHAHNLPQSHAWKQPREQTQTQHAASHRGTTHHIVDPIASGGFIVELWCQ